ncbi:GNAT family N-acetyltransferase [Microbulbifer hydrolyticus]|uniref:GNAT family N-acetyltransferase n=1 Tax=Microbulbifer hydrolyticus TaxID=48074 RepID=A0A6P1T8K2_9GAMM|nr:GNAT family N-acetyltransferase [Microbulbifer hydrolyticus]MBB5210397.1 GNAT superfamily N-acetyltransferase [Microbulbifer hydrolyticus]QHQ39118.1 GNAT family N-acetyltransferase [Microbulbifer hydrolyticus]
MSSDQPNKALSRAVTEKLRNGQVVTIRPMEPGDIELERVFITNLSPESRHQRFLGGVGAPSQKLLEQLTDVDHNKREAFIALIEGEDPAKEIGVSRYALESSGKAAECAVVIADEWQMQGLGTLLLDRLIESARARGIEHLYSIDSASNNRLSEVARHMGWERRSDPQDSTQVIYTLDLTAT